MTAPLVPKVVLGEPALRAVAAGAEKMARLLRPSLGPHPRTVLVGSVVSTGKPVVLDHGATIARRAYELGGRTENVGAMLVRHVAWKTYQEVGDGSATAGIIAARLITEALRLIGGGVGASAIGKGYGICLQAVGNALAGMARPIEIQSEMVQFLRSSLSEPGLAEMMSEIIFSVGRDDGAILVEDASGIETVHEYVEGMRWEKGWLPGFASATAATQTLNEPRILVTTISIETREQIMAIIAAAGAIGSSNLLIVAPSVGSVAAAFLAANRNGRMLRDVAVCGLDGMGAVRDQLAVDLAIGTGGRCMAAAAGDRLEDVKESDLGRARVAWVRRNQSAIIGGRGTRSAVRKRLAEARAELANVSDEVQQKAIRRRIGRLNGVTAVVMVGAPTESEQASLKMRIEGALAMARSALEGVVPGGALALVRAGAAIDRAAFRPTAPIVAAFRRALTEPMRVMCANAGFDSATVLGEVEDRPNEVFDLLDRAWKPTSDAGIFAAVGATMRALAIATSAARAAVETAAVVHGRDPEQSVSP